MRKLRTSDIFAACRLIQKIGVREEIQNVVKAAEDSKTKKVKTDMGVELLFGIIEKATSENNEAEIYNFLAPLFECEAEAVRDMPPVELLDKLQEVASIEDWKNFFGRVAALMKKK